MLSPIAFISTAICEYVICDLSFSIHSAGKLGSELTRYSDQYTFETFISLVLFIVFELSLFSDSIGFIFDFVI